MDRDRRKQKHRQSETGTRTECDKELFTLFCFVDDESTSGYS